MTAPLDTARRAADLVNVLVSGPATPERVAEVLRRHGEPGPLELSGDDVAELSRAAMLLREIFAATEADRAAELLNAALAAHARPPRLTTHGGTFGWHLHVDSSDDAPWGEWLLTSSCLALAVLLSERQAPPGGVCAAPSCGKSFVDTGRGSPRRYCSTRCATRERVAAHRRRGPAGSADPGGVGGGDEETAR
jgi:predicted RNA-binding Zn ribbon-like protein